MISEKHRFIFIHIPKTGGNSVQNILREYSEDEIVATEAYQDGVERFEVRNKKFEGLVKHSTLNDYYRVLGDDLKNYYVFTTIRNPFDKLVSNYFSPHRGDVRWDSSEFSKFVRGVKPIDDFISLSSGLIGFRKTNMASSLNYIMRFENLSDDFSNVLTELGFPKRVLPHRNKSSNRMLYQDCYDEDLRRFVEERHKFEIELGEYEFS